MNSKKKIVYGSMIHLLLVFLCQAMEKEEYEIFEVEEVESKKFEPYTIPVNQNELPTKIMAVKARAKLWELRLGNTPPPTSYKPIVPEEKNRRRHSDEITHKLYQFPFDEDNNNNSPLPEKPKKPLFLQAKAIVKFFGQKKQSFEDELSLVKIFIVKDPDTEIKTISFMVPPPEDYEGIAEKITSSSVLNFVATVHQQFQASTLNADQEFEYEGTIFKRLGLPPGQFIKGFITVQHEKRIKKEPTTKKISSLDSPLDSPIGSPGSQSNVPRNPPQRRMTLRKKIENLLSDKLQLK